MCLGLLLFAASLSAQTDTLCETQRTTMTRTENGERRTENGLFSEQYNKLYKAYVREPNDVANLLAMALFYADTTNPMQDYPLAMRFASQAEEEYIAILEDRHRYKEAKKLIKKNITIVMVRQTKQRVILNARRRLEAETLCGTQRTTMTDAQLDSYATAFSNDARIQRLVESIRLQSRYQQAVATNTLAAYRTFVESYANTDEGEDAAARMGDIASSLIEDAQSEAEVDRRLEGYLDLPAVSNVAMRKKSTLAYNALLLNPTPKAYRDYITKYPGSDNYSTVLAKLDESVQQEFEQLHTARQYADFAADNADNPLADEAIARLKRLITEQRDFEAFTIYLKEFPLDVNYNDIFLTVFNWHTEEGNLAPVAQFEKRFPDFPFPMALQDALKAAQAFDSITIPRTFHEKDLKKWESKIRHLTGKKESYVALQRTLSNLIDAKNWNKALQRIDDFKISFEDNSTDEVAELRSILESPADSRLNMSIIVRPAYDLMRPVFHPEGKNLFFNRISGGHNRIQMATPTPGKKGTVWYSTGIINFSNLENSDIEIFSFFDGGNKMLLGKNGDIMVAQKDSTMSSWTVIETLPEPVNMPNSIDFDAFMLPDGSGILFASDREGGHNLQPSFAFFHGDTAVASDIYFAPFSTGKWGQPINLGININSPYKECSPVISDDLKTIYFITDGRGLGFGDIYYATRDNEENWTSWSKAVNYGKEVNSGFDEKTISILKDHLIVGTNFDGYYGCYSTMLYHTINTDFTRVEIQAGNVGFTADIVELATRKKVGNTLTVERQSKWTGLLRTNQSFIIYAHQEGVYIPAILFTPSENANPSPQVYSAAKLLNMADEGKVLPLDGILFHEGKTTLENCSIKEIDHLADFLKRNMTVGAELTCHVDGDDDARCFKLSQERAEYIKQQLVARGIHPDRIATSPYGNSQTKSGIAKTSISLTLHRFE